MPGRWMVRATRAAWARPLAVCLGLIQGLTPAVAIAQTACPVQPVTISHGNDVSPNLAANTLVFINTTSYPTALCNDGSTPTFILRQAEAGAATRWVIHLHDGGDNCYDQPSCAARWSKDTNNGTKAATLTGSAHYGTPGHPSKGAVNADMYGVAELYLVSNVLNSGILNPIAAHNPDFWDANIVDVPYCSSDFFSGDKAASGPFNGLDPSTWNFRGRAILTAVIGTLEAQYGLASATEVLFSGSSAGGIATYLTVNDVAPLLPAGARLVVMGDAGFLDTGFPAYDITQPSPYLSTATPTVATGQLQSATQLWGGRGDVVCAATAATVAQQALCHDPSYLTTNRYIKTPFFIAQALFDIPQLQTNLVPGCEIQSTCSNPKLKLQQPMADTYKGAFAGDLQAKMVGSTPFFSGLEWSVPAHMLTNNATFGQAVRLTDGTVTSPAALVGAWYANPCSSVFSQQMPPA